MAIKKRDTREWGTLLDVALTVKTMERLSLKELPGNERPSKFPRGGSFQWESRLSAFRAECEGEWGESVTEVEPGLLRHGSLFAVRKAIALKELGRTPGDVSEGFITASGAVDGNRIEPREIFYQRFRPKGPPLNRMLVVSPPFSVTGRNYFRAASRLSDMGFDVLLMDHQWAGQSGGRQGALDRGFGVARDVAAVAEFAHRTVVREYPGVPNAGVTLIGKNLGGSAGVLGAMLYNDLGLLRLDGRPMPRGLDAVLVSPWFGQEKSLRNRLRKFASEVPIINQLAVPGESPGVRLDSPRDLKSRFRAMKCALPDITQVTERIAAGQTSAGRIYVIHSASHPYINPDQSAWLVSRYAERGTLRMVDTRHIASRSGRYLTGYVIEGVKALSGAPGAPGTGGI